MIFVVIFLVAVGAWEAYVFKTHGYAEDIFLSVGCFGAAAFLLAAMINKVELLP